jgi:predicted amidohydrolase YtcJ
VLDLLLENLYDPLNPEHDCLGIEDGIISYLGRGDGVKSKRKIDLSGCTVLPGFVDSHTHMLSLGLRLTGLDLSEAKSREEAIELVKKASRKGSVRVVGRGWDESAWGEKDYLSRSELDFTDKPVILYRKDGHMAVLNSAALEAVRKGERRDGILREQELELLKPLVSPSKEEAMIAIDVASEKALSEGVTCVRDIVDSETFGIYRSLSLPIKVRLAVYESEFDAQMTKDSRFWGVKLFLDGSIGARTAAVSGWPKENLIFREELLRSICRSYWRRGIPVAAHSIGDLAVKQAVKVISEHRGGLLNSIEHFELAEDEDVKGLGSVTASCQPNFLQWSGRGGLYESRLGEYWTSRNNPYRSILDLGRHLAFGSDCMPFGPSFGIYMAVSSPFSSQRISLEEAITSYTFESARLCGINAGRIALGMSADLSVYPPGVLVKGRWSINSKPIATLVSGKVKYGRLDEAKSPQTQ